MVEPRTRVERSRWRLAMQVEGLNIYLPDYQIGKRNWLRSALQWVVERLIP